MSSAEISMSDMNLLLGDLNSAYAFFTKRL